MKRYSILSLVRNARRPQNWQQAWRNADLKSHYEVAIIGGGGHGLATAYYLAKVHGVRDVLVVEKGWIGGGNTGRNTTNVRSDYLLPESAALYDLGLRLYEGLTREINFNIMLSQRGWLTLIHDQHQMEVARHKANSLRCNGVDGEIIDHEEVRRMLPQLNMEANARFNVVGGFLQRRGGTIRHDAVAWGYARAADALGVDIVQNCPVTGFTRRGDRIVTINSRRGDLHADRIGVAVAGHSSVIADMAGFRLPVATRCLQAMVSEPVKQLLDHVVLSPSTGAYLNQTQKGEIVLGSVLDGYQSYSQRGNFPTIEKSVCAAVEMFPVLKQARLMRHWSGIVDISPDSSPVLGRTPVSNLHISCGWGTGGFKAIPAGGYLLAHAIVKDAPHPLAEEFGLERFETNRLIDEAAAAGIAH